MRKFVLVAAAFSAIVLGMIWKGYVLSILWGWFIVTTFGAKPIGIAAAIGLSFSVTLLTFTYTHREDKREPKEKLTEGLMLMFISPLASLAFGAVVRLWM